MAQTTSPEAPYSVVDRGGFYRVLQRTVWVTNNATGLATRQVQGYTELENGIHYLSNNVWVESRDLIEPTETGAQEVHGPLQATFNFDITSVGAISFTSSSGHCSRAIPLACSLRTLCQAR
ncbi:MAG TPA: hypothetical protein VKY92_18145 [Verrucomicrobiae bacterium]|nr:hypothetical protein [Verrucomicrobiae bacterium]